MFDRTSSKEQHSDQGIQAINEYYQATNLKVEKIFTDQQTGKNFNRPRHIITKEDVLRRGDTLIISKLERMDRNKKDTLKELRYYKDNEIRVMILEIPTTLVDYRNLDNSMATMIMNTVNNTLIEMYTVFAQIEVEKKEIRQREGIDAKKVRC